MPVSLALWWGSVFAMRFRDRPVVFKNGSFGLTLEVPSASPRNYYQAISEPDSMPRVTLDGKLFLPEGASAQHPVPVVMVVPGSLGVAESHLMHAESFVEAGYAAFVLDNFGARSVTSTVANQTQFSFAASAYDVLASFLVLAARPEIDKDRIAAQGHSRGGSAVLTASARRFADPVLGEGVGLCGVLAAYPWCGHQFEDPRVGDTRVFVLMGDRDEWCSPMQVQGHCHALRLVGADATLRLIGKAHHSFDRGTELEEIEGAKISPAAPTGYIDHDGAFFHPLESKPDKELVDRDLMVYALKAGYGRVGARIGSAKGESERFRGEMLQFFDELFASELG